MKALATRSESALVRPFAGIADAEPPLDQVRFVAGGVEFEAGPVVLSDEAMASARFALKLPDPQDVRSAVERTVVPYVDCGLVVLGSARTNRVSRVFLQQYLRIADWPTEFSLNRAEADLVLNDTAGFTLTVAVVLLNDLVPEPLRPSMAGTWLARRDFRVSRESDESAFSPEPLTEEMRVHLGLPDGVLRYVEVDGILEEESLADAVRVYVDEGVLNLLHASPGDSASVQIQIELAVQATESVAIAIARELGDGSVPAEGSLDQAPVARSFVENLARNLGLTVGQTLELAASQPALLRARLEASFGMRDATSLALREK